jgi:hypothetical protein
MVYAAHEYSRTFLRLLRLGPFDRAIGAGWRFGTKPTAERIVQRLIAAGLARREGDFVIAMEPAQICATGRKSHV